MRFHHVVCSLLLGLTLGSGAVIAEDERELDFGEVVRDFETKNLGNDFKVRGWAISNKVHFGQARIAGETGLGFVVDQGKHQWGFSDKGVAYNFQF